MTIREIVEQRSVLVDKLLKATDALETSALELQRKFRCITMDSDVEALKKVLETANECLAEYVDARDNLIDFDNQEAN